MNDQVQTCLADVLRLWNHMKSSEMEDAGDDADRFQMAFYEFTDEVKAYVKTLPNRPSDAEEARDHSDFAPLFQALPDELLIPFETELDAILEENERQTDSTEQS